MKMIKSALLSLVLMTALGCVTALAQTQAEMNDEAYGEYKKADVELNKVYRQILSEYKKDTIFIQKLKAAQRAWMVFRDAHLAAIYPSPKPGEYGSVNPMCRCVMLTSMTNERIKVLREWVEGAEQGEVCAGSIKMKK